MTEDEERHADEVNIAFQMGAEWERKQTKARIEKLEAENKKFKCGLWSVINLCKWGVDRIPSFCSEPEGFCQCRKAFDALDYDLSNMYPMD